MRSVDCLEGRRRYLSFSNQKTEPRNAMEVLRLAGPEYLGLEL